MTVPTNFNHIATAIRLLADTDELCSDFGDPAAIAIAQAQATAAVAHAILALVRCLHSVGDDAQIPISGTVTR